jgi:hypothetical protein
MPVLWTFWSWLFWFSNHYHLQASAISDQQGMQSDNETKIWLFKLLFHTKS